MRENKIMIDFFFLFHQLKPPAQWLIEKVIANVSCSWAEGHVFQLAIITPQINLLGYNTATAQN